MAAEEILNLFDLYWFQSQIFSIKPFFSSSSESTPSILNTQDNEEISDDHHEQSPKLSRAPTFLVKSFSDQNLRSKDCCLNNSSPESPSPKSVLHDLPKLQTILSGKEVAGEFQISSLPSGGHNQGVDIPFDSGIRDDRGISPGRRRRWRKRSRESKSLSELEFEELKGFMDLGFVFSDEAKDSSLVSIIPGLQRMRMKDLDEAAGISRPYLSEAWSSLEVKKKAETTKQALIPWRIPEANFGNEMEMKNQLRFWAHNVASAVR